MHDPEWVEYFTKELAKAEKKLADFQNCVANHGLRVRERDLSGERDVTERDRQILRDKVDEYRKLLAR